MCASRYAEFCIHVRFHSNDFQMLSRDEKEADVGDRHMGCCHGNKGETGVKSH